MKEDTSSDSDYELIQTDDKLENKNEMENKNVLVKPENQINVEELKQTFQQMIDEIKIENVKQNSALKEIIEQNEGEIIFLENKIKKMEESTDKKFDELTEEMEQINNFNLNKELSFVHVANKWKEIKEKCCEAKCINIENPIGTCIKGNGFVNLINDENIEYIECEKKDDSCYVYNKPASIYAENAFNKPKDCSSNYSIFYFEIKYKIKEEKNLDNYRSIDIGLKNSKNNYVKLSNTGKAIYFNLQNKPENDGYVNLDKVVFKNNDIVGCGLVYPPSSYNRPYIFFTHNGKQIGKTILMNDTCDDYKPYIEFKCFSVETNFGKDLKANPFAFDFSKHKFHKYSDFEKDLNELTEMFPMITKEGMKQLLLAKGGIKEIVLKKLEQVFPKTN